MIELDPGERTNIPISPCLRLRVLGKKVAPLLSKCNMSNEPKKHKPHPLGILEISPHPNQIEGVHRGFPYRECHPRFARHRFVSTIHIDEARRPGKKKPCWSVLICIEAALRICPPHSPKMTRLFHSYGGAKWPQPAGCIPCQAGAPLWAGSRRQCYRSFRLEADALGAGETKTSLSEFTNIARGFLLVYHVTPPDGK